MSDILALLQDFYRDKLTAVSQHIDSARWVPQYDANNAYQYVIGREETQLSWIGRAIADLGGTVPSDPAVSPRQPSGKKAEAARSVMTEDSRDAQAFVDRWRPRVETMTNARHRAMLDVILGETLEQKRFFDQALAGSVDLLGHRSAAVGARVGEVLPTRWIE